ncbi:MAG: sigma-70 family RNA polymerase sigma factor [Pseudomonadota bacterium]
MHDGGIAAEDEGALIARFAAGDRLAAARLTSDLLPGVLRHARWRLRSEAEAEEVAQEAMLRFWRQAPTWRAGEAKASTWLYGVTRNLCIDRQRRRRPTTDVDDMPERADPTPGAAERMVSSERMRLLTAEIMALPERQREALRLRHFEALGNPEIAERLETSVEAVESLLARARRHLAARMRALEDDEDDGNGATA